MLLILLAGMSLFLVSSCTECHLEEAAVPREADVRISFTGQGTARSGNDTRAEDETRITSAIVLVYNASQVFEKSGDVNGSNSITLTLREGKKYIFVVANPCSALRSKLEASPSYTALGDMLSEAGDYNAGQAPAQGLLMSGKAEPTISVGAANTVNVEMTFCMARVDLYIRKGSNDVDNITVNSVSLINARSNGYLFKSGMSSATVTNSVGLLNSQITTYTAGADGTQIGMQYTYPTLTATDIAFSINLKHANATSADTYIIYLNAGNASAGGSTLERGKHYKVLVTFAKDEQGSLSITTYTQVNTDFTIG